MKRPKCESLKTQFDTNDKLQSSQRVELVVVVVAAAAAVAAAAVVVVVVNISMAICLLLRKSIHG